MIYEALKNTVTETFVENRQAGVDISKAYGLFNHAVVQELISISNGMLKTELQANDFISWSPGDAVKTYYERVFKVKFRCVAESLEINYKEVAITSTAVECVFSIAGSLLQVNNSAIRNSQLLQQNVSVKGSVVRKMRAELKHSILKE